LEAAIYSLINWQNPLRLGLESDFAFDLIEGNMLSLRDLKNCFKGKFLAQLT